MLSKKKLLLLFTTLIFTVHMHSSYGNDNEKRIVEKISKISKISEKKSYKLLKILEKKSTDKLNIKYGENISYDVIASKKWNDIIINMSKKTLKNQKYFLNDSIPYSKVPFESIKNILSSYAKIKKSAYIIKGKNIVPYTDSIGNIFIGDDNYKKILINNVEKEIFTHEAMHIFYNFENIVYYPGTSNYIKIRLDILTSNMLDWGTKYIDDPSFKKNAEKYIIMESDSIASLESKSDTSIEHEIKIDNMSFKFLNKNEILKYIKSMKSIPNFNERYKSEEFKRILRFSIKDTKFRNEIIMLINN